MNANSTGNGAPSIRSINVRANLLAEWTTDQIRFRAETTRYMAGIAVCCLLLIGVMPASEGARGAFVVIQKQHETQLAQLKGVVAQAEAANKAAQPKVETAELRAQTSIYFNRLLGEAYAVLDAAKSGMAFSSAKIDVNSAEIVIDCRADAENYDIAAAFAEQAGRTPNKISSLASTRPSSLLAPGGISFDYMKRVSVK